MTDKLIIVPQPIHSATKTPIGNSKPNKTPSVSFSEVLNTRLQDAKQITFSRHATDRMASRGINLNSDEMARLHQALNRVSEKGARDSLILLGETALVVSVKNNTVVTVIDKNNLNGNVFTNIDSAVIA